MRKKKLLLFGAPALGLLLVVALMAGWFEPRYRGTRASHYVFRILDTPRFSTANAREELEPMGAKLALPALLKGLTYEDSALRRNYIKLHTKSPRLFRKFLPAPRSVQHIRRNAISALTVFGPDAKPAVPILLRLFPGSDEFNRLNIVSALGAMGPAAGDAVPLLVDELSHKSAGAARGYIAALGKIELDGERSAPVIISHLNNWQNLANPSVLVEALDALGAMSRRRPALATNLWAHTRHPHSSTRFIALRNLDRLGLLTRNALDPFFQELTDDESAIRLNAIEVVTFGTNFAVELVPVLLRAANNDRADVVRNAAFGALLRYASWTNVAPQLREDALLVLARSTNWPSWTTLDAIHDLAPRGEALTPLLIPVLSNAEPRLRGKAAQALANLGPAAARSAAPHLRALLTDDWAFVRQAATNALRAQ